MKLEVLLDQWKQKWAIWNFWIEKLNIWLLSKDKEFNPTIRNVQAISVHLFILYKFICIFLSIPHCQCVFIPLFISLNKTHIPWYAVACQIILSNKYFEKLKVDCFVNSVSQSSYLTH